MQLQVVQTLSHGERAELRQARAALEHPGLAMQIANAVGTPIGYLMQKLPRGAKKTINNATRAALLKALGTAIERIPPTSPRVKRTLAAISGLLGGAMGWVGLVVDLPATTLLILKQIAEVAGQQGADLDNPAVRLECLSVLALGNTAVSVHGEEGYFALRAALAQEVAAAAHFLAKQGTKKAASATPPAVLRLINMVAARFSTPITEKAAAQVVPVLGAVSGATINYLFMEHYQKVAHAHFTIRRLERKYGIEVVEQVLMSL